MQNLETGKQQFRSITKKVVPLKFTTKGNGRILIG